VDGWLDAAEGRKWAHICAAPVFPLRFQGGEQPHDTDVLIGEIVQKHLVSFGPSFVAIET
jgi:hypothetical protein